MNNFIIENHNILLELLEHYGITQSSILLFACETAIIIAGACLFASGLDSIVSLIFLLKRMDEWGPFQKSRKIKKNSWRITLAIFELLLGCIILYIRFYINPLYILPVCSVLVIFEIIMVRSRNYM